MKRFALIIIGILFIQMMSQAQSRRWKRTRYELLGGLGVTAFMGDLGGGDKATHTVTDFNFLSQRPVMQVGGRYKIYETLAVKAALSFGWISGDDAKSRNIFRLDRNLSFRSPLLEFGGQLEYSIVKEPSVIRNNLRRHRKFTLRALKEINTYIFVGVSGFMFNPKGKDPETGKWVALQPLGTEGQGLVDGRDKYSRISLAFPFGIGFKYNIDKKIAIGLEFGARYAFTDYLDDVSTTYVDNAWLASQNELAARMADKCIHSENPLETKKNVLYGAGEQRGEAMFNDFYMFSVVTVTYKLKMGRNGLPKF